MSKNYKTLELPPKYAPKKSEKYMCLQQRAYFYQLLMAQKIELESSSEEVMSAVRMADKLDNAGVGDESDVSTQESEMLMNIKLANRNENLLKKINYALERLENGTYGFSVISDEEIGIARLMATPHATMTVEEKEESEKRK